LEYGLGITAVSKVFYSVANFIYLSISILKQAESGTPVPNLCREHGMSSATFYKWKAKYGGMDISMMTRLKELEAENARLKRMYADERLKADILQDALSKKL
jgi:putative transposase